jgi:hypothetical protein
MNKNFLRACAGILLLALATASWADDSTAVEGSYVIVTDQSPDIDTAIETTIATMGFIKRPIARGRLKDTNPVYRHIVITSSGGNIEIRFDDRKPIVAPADGSPVQWTREDGEVFDIAVTRKDGRLSQSYESKDGNRLNVFHIEDSTRRLHLDVTITSERLPQPLKYTLVYRRE